MTAKCHFLSKSRNHFDKRLFIMDLLPIQNHLLLLLRNYNTPSPINFRNFYVPLKKEGLQGRNLEPMNCDLSGS